MPILKKRGQLSLEFVLLLFGVIVAGTFVAVNLADQNPAYLGDSASKIKKESLGLFIGKGVNFSSTTTVNSSGYDKNSSSNITTNITINETENITTEINNSITNDTSQNISTDNNTNENLTTNETIKLPNLFIENLSVVENGSVIACHCFRERVQNNGEDTNLQNRFQHRCGKCKNGTNVDIVAVIGNNGTANCNLFQVVMYDNDVQIYNNTFQNLNVNETLTITVPYEISTSKGCKHQNKGESQQNQYRGCCCERVFNHTITVKVIATNDSNPDDNSASVVISIEKENGCNNCNGKDNENTTINNTSTNIASEGSVADYLYIKFNGNSNGIITSDIIPDGQPIFGDFGTIRIKGKHVGKYNANGEISGKIIINGNGLLYLGNLSTIYKLELKLNGNSDNDVDYTLKVPEIVYLDAGVINGNAELNLDGITIDSMYVERVNGNANLDLSNGHITVLEIDKINSNANVKIENMKIDDLSIEKIMGSGEVIITNSEINGIYYNYLEIDKYNYEDWS
ncbi:class III signal peptide-containing protein [Methanocaldococcus sp.]